jgi:hypothetical protein
VTDRDWILIVVALNAANLGAALIRTWIALAQRRRDRRLNDILEDK